MLTDDLKDIFNALKMEHGSDSLLRVETMLTSPVNHREPSQSGAKFVLPGVSTSPWRNISDYQSIHKVVSKLESIYPIIKNEVQELKCNVNDLSVYDHYLVDDTGWKALYLYKNNEPQMECIHTVPRTLKFMQEDLNDLLCPFGEMHFSILQPGTCVPIHCDLWNFTLNLHFAVDVPDGCGIRVTNETRQWENGKCLLFDYSHEHEAWNKSSKIRICLLMDIWNPELTQAEKSAVTALVTEIRSYL